MKVALAAFSFVWAAIVTVALIEQADAIRFVQDQAQICMDVLRSNEVLK